jgi:hypothetical protein
MQPCGQVQNIHSFGPSRAGFRTNRARGERLGTNRHHRNASQPPSFDGANPDPILVSMPEFVFPLIRSSSRLLPPRAEHIGTSASRDTSSGTSFVADRVAQGVRELIEEFRRTWDGGTGLTRHDWSPPKRQRVRIIEQCTADPWTGKEKNRLAVRFCLTSDGGREKKQGAA